MKNLSPIVLFVYNRPWHLTQTLNSLINNDLASDSILYIYADGIKSNASDLQKNAIADVRRIIHNLKFFKEVHVFESEKNKGLADSIIYGVSEVINKHGKVIVLEDDLILSKGFLRFMNEALDKYEKEVKVAGISGFSFIESPDETFFLSVGSSWGWATWKRVWEDSNFNTGFWLEKFENKKIISKFNIENNYDYYRMLKNQHEGKTNSWAIRFYCSYFFKHQLFLYPKNTLVFHIGYDEGTNCFGAERSNLNEFDSLLVNALVQNIEVIEKETNKELLIQYYKKNKRGILKKLWSKIGNLSFIQQPKNNTI